MSGVAERTVASPWRRLGAFLFDALVLFAIGSVPSAIMVRGNVEGDLYPFLASCIGLVYYAVGNSRGATLGKLFVGINATDADGERPGLKRGLLRTTPGFVAVAERAAELVVNFPRGTALLFLTPCLGYALILWDANRQSLYDKLAGTFVVVRRRSSFPQGFPLSLTRTNAT